VSSLENETGQSADQTQVAAVLSVKKDNGVLWFYVQWESEMRSFIPARVLNKIAPEKVIEYYEGLLTFQPDKEKKPTDLEKMEQPQPSDMQVENQTAKKPLSPEHEPKSHAEHKHLIPKQEPGTKEEKTKPRKQLYSKHQQQQSARNTILAWAATYYCNTPIQPDRIQKSSVLLAVQ